MKNARLFIILGVFVFITTLIILCSTVFTLNTIDLGWLSTTKVLSDKTDKDIIDSGEFNFGESVFLLKKDKYKHSLTNDERLKLSEAKQTIKDYAKKLIAEKKEK